MQNIPTTTEITVEDNLPMLLEAYAKAIASIENLVGESIDLLEINPDLADTLATHRNILAIAQSKSKT